LAPSRVVVIGGGVAGLGVGLGLARAGWPVVVVDRDELTPADRPDSAFAQARRGAPQVHHTHGLLARLTATTRERFPDVLAALVAVGGVEVDLGGRFEERRPADDDLRVLLARRTTLDWALRRAAAAEPSLTLLGGEAVDSLIPGAGVGAGPAPPSVAGVRLASGEELPASVVVAAAGSRAPVPRWLGELGVQIGEEEHDTGIVYLTRWYRTGAGWDPVIDGEELVRLAGDLGYLFYLAVPADQGAFSLTMAIGATDAALRSQLLDPAAFDRAARALPLPEGLVARLVPDGPVHRMGGLVNRIRRFVDADGGPLVIGFHAVGDAHTCTNPIYGRGCSLALVQAVALTEALTAEPAGPAGPADPPDPVARARAYEGVCRELTEPWYHISVETDRARQARYRRDGQPGSTDTPSVMDQLLRLGADDPIVGRAILRAVNLLATPQQLMNEPDVMTRIVELAATHRPAPHPRNRWAREGPSRQEMIDLTAA
jgi:2-polyprenyl-6-methoxyphenol hydroxylase-like FAD-dependent oxidoreductase